MKLGDLIHVRPLPFAVSCWALMILIHLTFFAIPESMMVLILTTFGGLLILLGYPLWVVYYSGLPASTQSKRVVGVSLAWLGGIVTLGIAFQYPDQSVELGGSSPAIWEYPLGLLSAFAVFSPLVIAARVLRKAELARGITIVAGGISAFLWFFYFAFGWGPLHKRVRAAAGVT